MTHPYAGKVNINVNVDLCQYKHINTSLKQAYLEGNCFSNTEETVSAVMVKESNPTFKGMEGGISFPVCFLAMSPLV